MKFVKNYIKSRPKLCMLSNTDDVPASNKVQAMVKEEVAELLEKGKRKCNVVLSNLEEDCDIAGNVNDEQRVKSSVHDVLQAGDIVTVSTVRVAGIQSAMMKKE